MAVEQLENFQEHAKTPGGNWLKFSVENILKPNFGSCVLRKASTPIFQRQIRRLSETSGSSEEEDEAKKTAGEERISGTDIGKSSKDVWPAWVFCTRYSDRPSSGPRSRRTKKTTKTPDEKRPRTAFSGDQLSRLKHEFAENRYLTERRRQDLAKELGLNEAQIKIWFQNKRAKMKKAKGDKNPLALQLMAQGLYNHTTIGPEEEDYLQKMALETSRSSCSSPR